MGRFCHSILSPFLLKSRLLLTFKEVKVFVANIRIALNSIKKSDILTVKSGISAPEIMQKYKPDYLINLGLYDMATKTHVTFLKDEKEKKGYYFSQEGFGVDPDGKIYWTTYQDEKAKDFIGGSPTLVKEGQVFIGWGNKKSNYINGKHNRSLVGINDTAIILCATDEKVTLTEAAEIMLKLGAKYAINCDGGGSSHLQAGATVYKKSIRYNVSWLLVYLKEGDKVIQDKLIPINKRRTGKALTPTTLTIHSTGNLKSTAQNERDYLASTSNDSYAGFHVVVDEKEAIKAIPFNEVAYHSGTTKGNTTSLSLEICESGNREKTLQNAIEATVEILRQYGWGVDKLKQHHDWNGKNCPRILRDTGKWNWFINEVRKQLAIVDTTVTYEGKELQAKIIDGTTYAPVRVLAESLGLKVNYNATTKKTVIIK